MDENDSILIAPPPSNPPGMSGWFQSWVKVITHPGEQTFVEIIASPAVPTNVAYLWVFLTGTLIALIQVFASSLNLNSGFEALASQIPGLNSALPAHLFSGSNAVFTLIAGLCLAPFSGLISLVFFAVATVIVQWLAKLFGGTGRYDMLLYARATVNVPFTLISSVFSLLGMIPYVGFCIVPLAAILGGYALILDIMAVKAVNRLGWGGAIASMLLPGFVFFLLFACLAMLIFAFLSYLFINGTGNWSTSLIFAGLL